MSMISYPLRVFFDCSTAHLSEASSSYLNVHADQGDELVAATPYGWFIWVGEGDRNNLPADLVGITEYARRLGAEYILFDRDAPEDDTSDSNPQSRTARDGRTPRGPARTFTGPQHPGCRSVDRLRPDELCPERPHCGADPPAGESADHSASERSSDADQSGAQSCQPPALFASAASTVGSADATASEPGAGDSP